VKENFSFEEKKILINLINNINFKNEENTRNVYAGRGKRSMMKVNEVVQIEKKMKSS
jgi:hypothetical protein